jgi:hypothetical protein
MSAIRPLSGAQRTSAQRVIRSATRVRDRPAGRAPWQPRSRRPHASRARVAHRWRRQSLPRCAAAARSPVRVRRSAARALAASERLSASVRFRAVTGRPSRLGCAKTGCEQSQQGSPYSITSSARTSSDGGTSRPSALAVFRLRTVSYLVGACTGSSAALAPRRMRST